MWECVLEWREGGREGGRDMLLAPYVCVIEAGGAVREEELLVFVIINNNGKFAKEEGEGEEQGPIKAAPKTEVNGEKKESKIPSGVSTNQTRELRTYFSSVVSYFLFCLFCRCHVGPFFIYSSFFSSSLALFLLPSRRPPKREIFDQWSKKECIDSFLYLGRSNK